MHEIKFKLDENVKEASLSHNLILRHAITSVQFCCNMKFHETCHCEIFVSCFFYWISNPLNQFQIEIRHFARLDRYFNQYHMFHYFNLCFHYFSFILFTVCCDCHISISTILEFLLKYTIYSSNYGGYLKLLNVGKSPYVLLIAINSVF